jgi:hypothetical protein
VLKAASQTAVQQAFRGITAGGGTSYGAGVKCLSRHKPADGEDVLFIFVGDEEDREFTTFVQDSGLNPLAFGFLRTPSSEHNRAVRQTAANLGIPCFVLDTQTFDDPYAVPLKLRALIASTPVGAGATPRVSLIEQILATKLLEKPAWAA